MHGGGIAAGLESGSVFSMARKDRRGGKGVLRSH